MDLSQKHQEIRNLIHHELKTPLVSIIGYCELLLDPRLGQLNPDQKEAVEEIYGNITQLQKLLEDVLENADIEQTDESFQIFPNRIKTPLIPILGFCELLLNPKYGQLNPDQKEAVLDIQKNSIILNHLINDYWNAQQLEIGEMKYFYEDINIEEFIQQTMGILDSLMKEKKIEFTKSIQPDLTIKADRSKFDEIFTNLVENSVSFAPEAGGKIQITVKSQDGLVQFSVEDNGSGIPKDEIPKLFKKFYQMDTSHTRKHGGSGLSLMISKGYMEDMGGKIWVESEEGRGTTFFFTIPKAE